MIPAGEAGHVADVADDGGGADRAYPKQPGQASRGCPDGGGGLLPGLADLGVDAAQILGEFGGKLQVGRFHRPCWGDRCQDLPGLARGDLLADAAGDQLAQHLVQPAGHLGAGLAQVPVALGPHLEHCRVIILSHLPDTRRAQRGGPPPSGHRWDRSC